MRSKSVEDSGLVRGKGKPRAASERRRLERIDRSGVRHHANREPGRPVDHQSRDQLQIFQPPAWPRSFAKTDATSARSRSPAPGRRVGVPVSSRLGWRHARIDDLGGAQQTRESFLKPARPCAGDAAGVASDVAPQTMRALRLVQWLGAMVRRCRHDDESSIGLGRRSLPPSALRLRWRPLSRWPCRRRAARSCPCEQPAHPSPEKCPRNRHSRVAQNIFAGIFRRRAACEQKSVPLGSGLSGGPAAGPGVARVGILFHRPRPDTHPRRAVPPGRGRML